MHDYAERELWRWMTAGNGRVSHGDIYLPVSPCRSPRDRVVTRNTHPQRVGFTFICRVWTDAKTDVRRWRKWCTADDRWEPSEWYSARVKMARRRDAKTMGEKNKTDGGYIVATNNPRKIKINNRPPWDWRKMADRKPPPPTPNAIRRDFAQRTYDSAAHAPHPSPARNTAVIAARCSRSLTPRSFVVPRRGFGGKPVSDGNKQTRRAVF